VISQLQQQGSITDADAAAATAAPLGVRPAQLGAPAEGCTAAGDAGYFCAYAVQYLEQAGLTPEQLAAGGYTVHTTLDPSALAAAKAAVDAQAPRATDILGGAPAVPLPPADPRYLTARVS
jgi:membrane peptidoglycan carboxypeptidase